MRLAKAARVRGASSILSGGPISRVASARSQRNPRLPARASPSHVLGNWLRPMSHSQMARWRPYFVRAALQRSERLPLLTLQALMRYQAPEIEKDIHKAVGTSDSPGWNDRVEGLIASGWSRRDLFNWVCILSPRSGDARVQRLVESGRAHPVFLLLLLVRPGERFRVVSSIDHLLSYVSRHYCGPKPDDEGAEPPRPLNVDHFLLFLKRIVHHVQRAWPSALPSVANVAASYIRSLSPQGSGYGDQCRIFHAALKEFEKPARTSPFMNRDFNWAAQKIMLSMSDSLDRPLVINQQSYREIRKVLVGLRKTPEEREVAQRYAPTWPPYRLEFDGDDAKRTPEDDYSRSVQAGILMTGAGYAAGDYDRALDILGGQSGDSPTIQRRALAPHDEETAGSGLHVRWAAAIHVTRNAYEAWEVFNSFSDAVPTPAIYTEMFHKLFAPPLREGTTALPGDGIEAWPVPAENYSEYELARRTPPTSTELYKQMRSQGITPEGELLNVLIRNAISVRQGLNYLRDAGFETSGLDVSEKFNLVTAQRLPSPIFCSYIKLLCEQHPNHVMGETFKGHMQLRCVWRAFHMAKTRHDSALRTPWHYILRALAREHIAMMERGRDPNDREAMRVAMFVATQAQRAVGMDAKIFMYLCRVLQKAAFANLAYRNSASGGPPRPENLRDPLVPNRDRVLRFMKSAFTRLAGSVERGDEAAAWTRTQRAPTHLINPAHLHSYMRTLAFLEDVDGMVDLFIWMLRNRWLVEQDAARLGGRGLPLVAKTLCAFRAFALPHLSTENHEAIEHYLQSSSLGEDMGWGWPSVEDAQAYVEADQYGRSVAIQGRLQAQHLPGGVFASSSAQREDPRSMREEEPDALGRLIRASSV